MPGVRLSRRLLLGAAGAASISPALPAVVRDAALSIDLPQASPAFEGRFRTGPQQRSSQDSSQYSAAILGGEVSGPVLQGTVQPGRIEWTLDAASQTVQVTAQFAVLRPDGVVVHVRDRSIHPQAIKPAHSTALRTAPEISIEGDHHDAAAPLLVGLLDASGFPGLVILRAFQIV